MRTVRLAVITAAASGLSAWLVGRSVAGIAGDRNAPWMLGRAAGITSYLLLVLLVVTGLLLSHPQRERWRRPNAAVRIRVHVSLAGFTLAFLVLHVLVLATDRYAHVGWWGAFVPMGSGFRPLSVTLGQLGLYAGLIAGVTAGLAGRIARRIWWPIHKISSVSLALVWAHGVFAGTDTGALLLPLYLPTGVAVLVLAGWRYLARGSADRVREIGDTQSIPVGHGASVGDR